MLLAGKTANETGRPVIFDPVGAGSSGLRTETAHRIMKEIKLSVIRANVSEIKALCQDKAMTKGVDADGKDALTKDSMEDMISMGRRLSEETGAVILMTGAVDLAVLGDRLRSFIMEILIWRGLQEADVCWTEFLESLQEPVRRVCLTA